MEKRARNGSTKPACCRCDRRWSCAADTIAFFSATGNWWVAASTGLLFGGYSPVEKRTRNRINRSAGSGRHGRWSCGCGGIFSGSGSWWVAPSTGSAFQSYSLWRSSHGAGSTYQWLSDVTGDGKVDAVVGYEKTGSFFVAPSLGNSFGTDARWLSGLAQPWFRGSIRCW